MYKGNGHTKPTEIIEVLKHPVVQIQAKLPNKSMGILLVERMKDHEPDDKTAMLLSGYNNPNSKNLSNVSLYGGKNEIGIKKDLYKGQYSPALQVSSNGFGRIKFTNSLSDLQVA